jgi:probable DNA repair protein
MGPGTAAEFDAWLRGGGLVVTASERAARALAAAFHRARRAEGLTAWPAPNILDWNRFVRAAWEDRSLDGRLLLNPVQEQSLWAGIAGSGEHMATLLDGPRHRLAGLALEAYELLCSYAPRFLHAAARAGWQQDAAAFSEWLTAFDDACRAGNLLSPSRLPLELIPLLNADSAERSPLLLVGFDRILPTQRNLFDSWGAWQKAAPDESASQILFHETPDTQAELAACALWCSRQLATKPQARLLVVTQDITKHRGEIERAFLQYNGSVSPPLFEFSLGIPLSRVALARSAHLLLRWLSGTLAEHEIDWLLFTGHTAASPQESSALQAAMRKLRHRNQQQPHWTLAAFIHQPPDNPLPSAWVNRMTEAQRHLAEFARRPQSPLDWAELISHLLEAAGWPGSRPLSSAEFQAARRWRQTIETCASLGFDGRRVDWQEFLSVLTRALDETLFAPESRDAPIQIAGPAESAGLTADAIWFLGADEDAWPARGSTHPLIPPEVQREAGMPHATPQLDWDLAQTITARLLASAPEVHFSFSRQIEGIEARPARLVAQLAGPPQPLQPELAAPPIPSAHTVVFEDASRIPFPPGKVEGGSSVLTFQSQCPFKAFATARLAAKDWSPAEAGLTASQRGILLHSVLHAIWAGLPSGISSLNDLQKQKDRNSFVATHVRRALQVELRPELRERMPRRYLELEEQRLTRLVTEWLEYEATRIDFVVAETEVNRSVLIAGLTFDLRLDRIDRLNDNSKLVIDYKTGDLSPKSWDLPRPDDVQLPLYAGFALDGVPGGLVFAKVRTSKPEFAGRVRNARDTLIANLSGNTNLVKKPLADELLDDWKKNIEQLARDFLAGRAEVDPRDYPKTCEHCGLQTLCRIQEHQAQLDSTDDSNGKEAASE